MNIYAICPKCKFEGEIPDIETTYNICPSCGELYLVFNKVIKLEGIELSKTRKKIILDMINKNSKEGDTENG